MRFVIDHDYHIHSQLSACSSDPEQTNERILQYALDNGLHTICLTNHFWDENLPGAIPDYQRQNFEHICSAKPLPKAEGVSFLFGCETELDKNLTLALSPQRYGEFSFIIAPSTHMHLNGFTIAHEDKCDTGRRIKLWQERLEYILSRDLPFYKVGIPHLTVLHIAGGSREVRLEMIESFGEQMLKRIFTKIAELGAGIELNAADMKFPDEDAEIIMRPYKVAKSCGCRFYLGSDAHHVPRFLEAKSIFDRAIDLLDLKESDKYRIPIK